MENAVPSKWLPPPKRMSRAENNYWALTCLGALGVAWPAYNLISGERRTIVVSVLLIAALIIFAIGVVGLRRIKKRRS
jgi:hypothetical protein